MRSKIILFDEPFKVSTAEIDLPEPEPGQLLVHTLVTGTSTGTENRVLSGKRRASKFPLIPGYENLGEVIKLGTGVGSFNLGDRVFHSGSLFTGPYFNNWGAHVEYALVEASRVFKIPASIPDLKAVYTMTCAIAYHGIQRARVKAGESVAIVGVGMIGHLAAQVARTIGARVIAIDPLQERLEVARTAGVEHLLNPEQVDIVAAVKELTHDRLDVAVDATGEAHTVNTTLQLLPVKSSGCEPSGRLLILGSYPEPVCFDYEAVMYKIEPDILLSCGATRQDQIDTLGLLASHKINPELIPAGLLPVSEAVQGYSALINRETMRVIYQWRSN